MPKKDKIPDFSFDDLVASMQQGADHAAGKITARTHQPRKENDKGVRYEIYH